MSWAPDGTKALFYRDRHWHVLDTRDFLIRNVTANIEAPFFNEDYDSPAQPGAYGAAGWTSDSGSVLLYDRFDVWQIAGDGHTFRSVTEGFGRKNNLQFRVVRLEREDDEDAPRGINPAKPLLLRAENLRTRDTGFFRDYVQGDSVPR